VSSKLSLFKETLIDWFKGNDCPFANLTRLGTWPLSCLIYLPLTVVIVPNRITSLKKKTLGKCVMKIDLLRTSCHQGQNLALHILIIFDHWFWKIFGKCYSAIVPKDLTLRWGHVPSLSRHVASVPAQQCGSQGAKGPRAAVAGNHRHDMRHHMLWHAMTIILLQCG
jgi:hypothetical protein